MHWRRWKRDNTNHNVINIQPSNAFAVLFFVVVVIWNNVDSIGNDTYCAPNYNKWWFSTFIFSLNIHIVSRLFKVKPSEMKEHKCKIPLLWPAQRKWTKVFWIPKVFINIIELEVLSDGNGKKSISCSFHWLLIGCMNPFRFIFFYCITLNYFRPFVGIA